MTGHWKAVNPHSFMHDFDRWFAFEVECAFNNGLPPGYLERFMNACRTERRSV